MARKNQNLAPDESAVLRALAEHHGYTASTGLYVGQGSAYALTMALVTGDVAVVSLDPDDRQALAAWLLEQDAPAHLAELVAGLAADLVYGLSDSAADEPTQASEGPISTMEG